MFFQFGKIRHQLLGADRFKGDLQKIVVEVGKEMQAYERKLFVEGEKSLADELKAKGMTFIEDVDQAAFAALADGAMQKLMNGEYSYLKPLYEKIKAVK